MSPGPRLPGQWHGVRGGSGTATIPTLDLAGAYTWAVCRSSQKETGTDFRWQRGVWGGPEQSCHSSAIPLGLTVLLPDEGVLS